MEIFVSPPAIPNRNSMRAFR